jgi:RNA polymerase sigma-54 factor
MALPVMDLKTRILEEVEKNPALEILKDAMPVSFEQLEKQSRKQEDRNTTDDGFDSGYRMSAAPSDGDSKRMFLEQALSRPESLQDHLIWQLGLQQISDVSYRIGESLIYNLDENGFHVSDPYTLFKDQNRQAIDESMSLIRGFDPIGCATTDYREALIVQALHDDAASEEVVILIRDHLDLLEKGKVKDIAKKMKVDEPEVEEYLALIRHYNPYPGNVYSSKAPRYVVPELSVKIRDGEFVLVINDDEIPVLGVNPFFTKMLNGKRDQGKEVKTFVNEKIREAKWFIRSINMRNETLRKVAVSLIEYQRDFFLKGPKYLVPLTLKDIAKEVGVHEATVSRITTGKYVQTEYGIFELKYFFTNSISGAGSTGSRFSKQGVKEVIREIVKENADSDAKLSDQKIMELLQKKGINIARRTVAKYRGEMDIGASYERS